MCVLQKEVRLLRRISTQVLDESTGSPESEAGSHTEGTPVGYHPQWSMSREDSEEEGAEVSSEVRAGCVCVQLKHNMRCRHQSAITHFALFCIRMYMRMYCTCENWGIVCSCITYWALYTSVTKFILCKHANVRTYVASPDAESFHLLVCTYVCSNVFVFVR